MIRLVIDTEGGDNSPSANIEGAVKALAADDRLYIIFTGNEEKIRSVLSGLGYNDTSRYEIVHAPDIITGEDKPTDAIRLKRDSSMMAAIKLLRTDDSVSGMVSTGATGALVAAATVRVGRVRGVIRPTFCPVIPNMAGGLTGICDSGANVDCSPEMLVQFAKMGSLYMENAFGVKDPKIGLLNIGTESEKGDDLRRETFKRLSATPGLNFAGNVEARELFAGSVDLFVCDGFSGNVLVKAAEGTALSLLKKIKSDIYSRSIYKFGAMFMQKMFAEEKEFMNYQNYGGSVLLGSEKIIVKGHGSSDAGAVQVCISQALRMIDSELNDKISAEFGTDDNK